MLRKIDDNKALEILIKLEEKFGFEHQQYWFPLSETNFKPVVAFNLKKFLKTNLPGQIKEFLQKNYKSVYEINEFEYNGSCFWEYSSDEIDFDWYSEQVLAFEDNEIMVYCSHEGTITFAGKKIIDFIENSIDDIEKILCYNPAAKMLEENMKVYSYKSIKCIEKDGIMFSDGFKIFFLDCIKGFGNNYNHFKNLATCIAERNSLAQPPYFQFYLDDMSVEIIFDCKGLFAKKRNLKLFQSFQLEINNFGYKTFDLT